MVARVLAVAAVALMVGCGGSSGSSTSDGPLDGGWWWNGDGPIQVQDGGVVLVDDGGAFVCYVTTCAGKTLECGDCQDNDGDGRIDWRDPECLGPCDNTEGAALTAGIGGETGGPCKADCYFDFGNGPGNDDCHWDHRCDPLAVAPDYPPEGPTCPYTPATVGTSDCPATQSQQCLDFCMPLTPNGCDCFGCCTFPELNGDYIWIGAMDDKNNGTCTFADILDPSKCPPCTPVADCTNGCGYCELCLGKDTLPADCFTDGGVPDAGARCAPGVQVCGLPGEADCPVNFFCITGCCVETIY